MPVENAGKKATQDMLVDVFGLYRRFYLSEPDVNNPAQKVSFGTSGHRGTSLNGSFTATHIRAITKAIAELRGSFGATGPLFLGMDTHALSMPAHTTALSVLVANGVHTYVAAAPGFTPTPVISRSIIRYNEGRKEGLADGIVITPSHNPPTDGGIKYNAIHGGPSGEDMTKAIAARANQILAEGGEDVKSVPVQEFEKNPLVEEYDYIGKYVEELKDIIDFDVIKKAHLRLGADALGGAGFAYWKRIAERYGLDITVFNDKYDPTFSFMCVDHDGKIRMDCSSPYAMAGLVAMKDKFDLGFANDPDFDRHGIVCPGYGLMNPNHYLAVAIDYLYRTRTGWNANVGIGKTLVSSMMIDRVAQRLGRKLVEVPVGFKWFVPGLSDGTLGFGGEESAGASFLKLDGKVWSTDKDGIILALLAAEITARTGKTPAEHYAQLEKDFGKSFYSRKDTPATPEQKERVASISPESIKMTDLAGDKITAILTKAPGNGAAIGGIKICAEKSWAAIRPSGTENICKVYAESLLGQEHLEKVIAAASELL